MNRYFSIGLSGLLLLTMSLMGPVWADETPTVQNVGHPGHKALKELAESVLEAMKKSPERIYDKLTLECQGRVQLQKASCIKRRCSKLFWGELEEAINNSKGYDPNGLAQVKTVDDYKALTPGKYFALHSLLYQLLADKRWENTAKEEFFLVDCRVTTCSFKNGSGQVESSTRGHATLENANGDRVAVVCEPEDGGWAIASFSWGFGFEPAGQFDGNPNWSWNDPFRNAALVEAKAKLGTLKDRARVVRQRSGKAPGSLEDLGVLAEDLAGFYFNESNYQLAVLSDGKTVRIACLSGEGGPRVFVAVVSNLSTGEATLTEYYTRLDFENATKEESKK